MEQSVAKRMLYYLAELERWNRRINLTAVPADEAWHRHIEEAVALHDATAPARGARVVDVGAGGGVPGIPMAILQPDLHVTLLDSDQRKAAFLTHVSGALRLDNVEVLVARAEDVAHREGMRESFDLAVSRALAPPAVMCELTLPLVRVGGATAALVGDAAEAARECASAAAALGGARPRAAHGDVLLVDKLQPTDARYPRRAGVPLRKPL